MAESSVPARTCWHECKSAGGSCCQPLSGMERRGAVPLSSPPPENQHSYSLLMYVQTSSYSLCLHAVFIFSVCVLWLSASLCLPNTRLSLPVSLFLNVFFFLFKPQPSHYRSLIISMSLCANIYINWPISREFTSLFFSYQSWQSSSSEYGVIN